MLALIGRDGKGTHKWNIVLVDDRSHPCSPTRLRGSGQADNRHLRVGTTAIPLGNDANMPVQDLALSPLGSAYRFFHKPVLHPVPPLDPVDMP